jgi:hypothetical protein
MLKLEKPPQKRVSAQELMKCVRFVRDIYVPVTGKAWLPADLQSMFENARKAHMMFTAEPALEVLSIHLKYAPCRHALLAYWKQRRSEFTPTGDIEVSSVDDSDLHARASRLHCALTHTINCVAQTKVPMCWVSNCSRTVGRHSAPQMVLHRLGLLKKGSCICFEHGSSPTWRLADSRGKVQASVRKLMKAHLGLVCHPQTDPQSTTQLHRMAPDAAFSVSGIESAAGPHPQVAPCQG